MLYVMITTADKFRTFAILTPDLKYNITEVKLANAHLLLTGQHSLCDPVGMAYVGGKKKSTASPTPQMEVTMASLLLLISNPGFVHGAFEKSKISQR